MDGVIYFNYGKAHLARLAVSLHSLRAVYRGPVAILNAGDDDGIACRLADDPLVQAQLVRIDIPRRRRHTAYCAKPSLWRWTPYDRSLYVDADTLFVSDPTEAIQNPSSLVVTRFSNWVTTGRIYSSRIRQWLQVPHDTYDVPAMAQACLNTPFPAINTGVFVFDRDNAYLSMWEAIAHAGHGCSFTDELALQILLPRLAVVGWLGDEWNASPIYRHCPPQDVRIWHFHGCKNLRKDAGKALWWPAWERAYRANIGGVRGWYACDKSLRSVSMSSEGIIDGQPTTGV